MSAFGNLLTTSKGINLYSKVLTGAPLKFTRIGIGDGDLAGSSIAGLSALKHEVKSLGISKLKTLTGGKAVVGTVLTNQDITTGFYLREIGIFALDPDIGEILYCYANAGATADYIPPGGGSDIIEREYDFNLITGNSSNVSAIIDSSLVYASAAELQALEQRTTDIEAEVDSMIKLVVSSVEPSSPSPNMLLFKILS